MEIIGGRKFILSLISMLILAALAFLKPDALTAELVGGILGVIAVFSGANSVLTAVSGKSNSNPPTQTSPPQLSMETAKQEERVSIPSQDESVQFESKLGIIQNQIDAIVSVLKHQGEIINNLTIQNTSSSLKSEEKNEQARANRNAIKQAGL